MSGSCDTEIRDSSFQAQYLSIEAPDAAADTGYIRSDIGIVSQRVVQKSRELVGQSLCNKFLYIHNVLV